jgi:O-Antigen ligase
MDVSLRSAEASRYDVDEAPRGGALASRLICAAFALAPIYVLVVLAAEPSIATAMKIAAAIVFISAIVRPPVGAVLVAVLVPLGDVMTPVLQTASATRTEALVLAFIAGWLISRAYARRGDRDAVSPSAAAAMWLFGGLIVASVATTALQLSHIYAPELRATWSALRDSYLWTDDPLGVHAAAHLLEGLAIVFAVSAIVRREPRSRLWILLSLVVSACVVGVASRLLAVGIAPATTISRDLAIGLPRHSAAMADVNAAGSYYVLMLGAVVGVAAAVRRPRGLWFTVPAVAVLIGLELTGSRGAWLSAAIVLGAAVTMWFARMTSGVSNVSRRSTLSRAVVVAMIAVIVTAAIALAANRMAETGLEMRGGFTRASARMIEERPVFGVGEGRYYSLSRLALPPSLAWYYGLENAHDYFLQTAAELGVFGLATFLWLLAAIIIRPATSVWCDSNRLSAAALAFGAVAYFGTAVGGHPFLVPEAAVPFWIVLGLLASEAHLPARRARFARLWPVAIGCLLLITVPFRPGPPRLRMHAGDDGFGPWRSDERGTAFREAKDFASVFLEGNVRAIEIPMKLGVGGSVGSGTAAVQMAMPGAFRRDVRIGRDWTTFFIDLPGAEPLVPRQRINLLVPSVVDVGQIKIIAAQ